MLGMCGYFHFPFKMCIDLSFCFKLRFQRFRRSSVRTLPERSEVKGCGREAQWRDESFRTGAPHRTRLGSERAAPHVSSGRHRKLSTASSPSSYKVWTSGEKEIDKEEEAADADHYGYVLPGSHSTPERGKISNLKDARDLTDINEPYTLCLCRASQLQKSPYDWTR